ncbi:hypothetical protein TraAM80_09685 [Trypanosoma rangeli]|uniref:Uncharacterized protein n=1 Tax=Trypanosoma rangeli TaxID=5698 RepID=A0A3R7M5Z5_TRYRA|nr:uncharacterized protein TraAM80_09685 [Trypanosoma rangeli]RNE96777.1 hypothetical protein TraAM80_09685 [Trypanosoma rangeli]|eukprot:RNE96777.1 hypothetical protein TraAM80_09685 [Trypanosoma rangeli]
MDYDLEYSEEQREYLERVGMRDLLETFVAEVVRQKPHDVYDFLYGWASARCLTTANMTHTQAAIKIQSALRQRLAWGLLHSRQRTVNTRVEYDEAQLAMTVDADTNPNALQGVPAPFTLM